MARKVLPYIAALLAGAALSGCGFSERPQRPVWRDRAEQACLSQRLVHASSYVRPSHSIDGPGICGLTHPFKVTALAHGSVGLRATGTLGCPMIASLDKWIDEVVQPAAKARFGQPVAEISSMGSYGCRPVNNHAGGKLSEHAFGNAIDIGGFRLADGREIKIVRAWTKGDEQEQAFLRQLHTGACDYFTTVLGPGSNALHYNHFHVDLAMHGNTSRGPRRYCRPRPQIQKLPPRIDNLPEPPPLEPDIDVARRLQPNIAVAAGYSAQRPGIAMAPQRLRSMPKPQGEIPLSPPMDDGGSAVYGRLQAGAGAPVQLVRPLPHGSGALRDDGMYVPPGEIGD